MQLVVEYCEAGNLAELYTSLNEPFSEEQIVFIAREVLQALSFLHSLRIMHRDVKASNSK